MITLAPRASAILYNLLKARLDRRPFLLPANICPIVPITFFKAGLGFEFVDISPATLNMDFDLAASLLKTCQYGGLLYAHTYGDPITPQAFFSDVKKQDESIFLIDDRCLCVPEFEPDPLNPADVLLFSTGHAKIVDMDFGGYAFIKAGIHYKSSHLPYNPRDLEAIEKTYKTSIAQGLPFVYFDNDWLRSEKAATNWSVYRDQIESKLSESLQHRRSINNIYFSQLPAEIQLPKNFQLWRFNLRVNDQQRIIKGLFTSRLFASAHYASLAGIMAPGDCPNSAQLAASVINLFNDHHYSIEMAEQTCAIVNRNL